MTTKTEIEEMAEKLNVTTGSPSERKSEGVSQVGHYYISYAYGGSALYRIVNTGGAAEDVLESGHITRGLLFDLMRSYLRGREEV